MAEADQYHRDCMDAVRFYGSVLPRNVLCHYSKHELRRSVDSCNRIVRPCVVVSWRKKMSFLPPPRFPESSVVLAMLIRSRRCYIGRRADGK